MVVSGNKGEKCILLMDNGCVDKKEDIEYVWSEWKERCVVNAPYTADVNGIEMWSNYWVLKNLELVGG